MSVRRLIVEVRSGPHRGLRRVLAPGDRARVGRAAPADLELGDRQLLAVHLELEATVDGGAVRPASTAAPVEVNGVAVRERAPVGDGDWIHAGTSDLVVYRESPPPAEALAPAAARALAALRQRSPLFAVVDAARDPALLRILKRAPERQAMLYEGNAAATLEDVAPYLVELPDGTPLLERLVASGWGKRWASYLVSRHPFELVRRHLRSLLTVQVEGAERPHYFRFYDPSVLRSFWRMASEGQILELGATIVEFAIEAEEADDADAILLRTGIAP
jgi:hypothetical protein